MAKKRKKMTLRQYYKTKHWSRLRSEIAYGDDAHCEICGCHRWVIYKIGPKKGQRKPKAENHLHLHHKHYDTMLNESRDDLMLLCDSCHKLGHMLEKMKNKSEMYKIMYEDFKKQTGWEFKKR
jgi:5-methylcytosine-specific restriction endonuclease McrA